MQKTKEFQDLVNQIADPDVCRSSKTEMDDNTIHGEYRFITIKSSYLAKKLESEYQNGYIPDKVIYTSPNGDLTIMMKRLTKKEQDNGERREILHD